MQLVSSLRLVRLPFVVGVSTPAIIISCARTEVVFNPHLPRAAAGFRG